MDSKLTGFVCNLPIIIKMCCVINWNHIAFGLNLLNCHLSQEFKLFKNGKFNYLIIILTLRLSVISVDLAYAIPKLLTYTASGK